MKSYIILIATTRSIDCAYFYARPNFSEKNFPPKSWKWPESIRHHFLAFCKTTILFFLHTPGYSISSFWCPLQQYVNFGYNIMLKFLMMGPKPPAKTGFRLVKCGSHVQNSAKLQVPDMWCKTVCFITPISIFTPGGFFWLFLTLTLNLSKLLAPGVWHGVKIRG